METEDLRDCARLVAEGAAARDPVGTVSLRLLVDIDQSVEWTLIATVIIAVCVVLLTALAILRI